MTDLTPAEFKAAAAMHLRAVQEGEVDADVPVEYFASAARAAVDAVRPLIAADTLHALATDAAGAGMPSVHVRHITARAGYAVTHPHDPSQDRKAALGAGRPNILAKDQPRRVRVEGDLYHARIPVGAVYVGRPAPGLPGSRWANPHPIGRPCRACIGVEHDRAGAIAAFAADLTPADLAAAHDELGGRDLACWCRSDLPCHADILLDAANTRTVTVRDLVRAARAAGAPLRRVPHPSASYRIWECWSEADQHRWATIRSYRAGDVVEWSAEINGRDADDGTVQVRLWQPTVDAFADAVRLCGWEVPS